MRIALVQQHATEDKARNLTRGEAAIRKAVDQGAAIVCFAELAFEPFHPQRRAQSGFESLAEPVPGPITETVANRDWFPM